MFFRFERQTRGRPAHADPAYFAAGAGRLSALCRGLVARPMRRSASALRKKTGGKGGKGANPRNAGEINGVQTCKPMAETGGNRRKPPG